MKFKFDVYRPGEPDAGIPDGIHEITLEIHDTEEDTEIREAANELFKTALAKLFETSERNVYTEEETKRIEDALTARGDAEAEGE